MKKKFKKGESRHFVFGFNPRIDFPLVIKEKENIFKKLIFKKKKNSFI